MSEIPIALRAKISQIASIFDRSERENAIYAALLSADRDATERAAKIAEAFRHPENGARCREGDWIGAAIRAQEPHP